MLTDTKTSEAPLSTPEKFKFRYGSKLIPHPDKIKKGGEDAFFVHDNILVIADGVGGWSNRGVDPALYSKRLCELIKQSFLGPSQKQFVKYPQLLIEEAVRNNKQIGSSTVTVITLEPSTGILRTAYLGDSIFSIFRDCKEHFSVPEQQHDFNKPYQVGSNGNHPSQASRHQVSTLPGDFVVLGTDGIWDNLPSGELKTIVSQAEDCMNKKAEHIANAASRFSQTENFASPFYEKAKKFKFRVPKGGKKDDITAVVATIERFT